MSSSAESLSPKEAFREYREATVRDALSSLLLPLVDEKPFARWNGAQLIQHISAETGLARSLVLHQLKGLAQNQTPLNEEGSTLYLAMENGRTYAQIIQSNEPISDLPTSNEPAAGS